MRGAAAIRSAALFTVLLVFVTACGTQIDEEQRESYLQLLAGGGGRGTGAGAVDLDEGFDDFEGIDDGQSGTAGGVAEGGAGTDGDPATSTGGQSEGGPGAPGGTAAGGQDGQTGQTGTGGGEPAAPSGPRTATDVGVTADEIVIANVSDISGPVPGLFESTRRATQAYAAYVNSRGGIHGRRVTVLPLDSRTDAGENRNATLQACERAFVMVGSMSAFDGGGAAALDECGIPAVDAIAVTAPRARAVNSFPAYPINPGTVMTSPADHIAQRYPEAVKTAAIFYTDAATSRDEAQKRKAAYEKRGFTFVYETAIGAVEANMAPYVLEMRRRGVEYVTGIGPLQQMARFSEAMAQQGFDPEVVEWDSVVYDPAFIQLGGQAVEGQWFFINTVMFEEINQHEELQRYVQWLQRTAPNAKPTYFGIYAWSAAALFEQVATAVGPELTRERFFAEIRKISEWNGRGLHVPHDIGSKVPSPCYLHGRVSNQQFVRAHPAQGFACGQNTPID